jgi:single-strand DNA-binding protein
MINDVTLVGRLTRDVELRSTKSGKPVASFTLAVDRQRKDDGADFIICVAWDKGAELIAQYVHKGDLLGITGQIRTRSYEDKEGRKVFVTEIVVRDFQFLQPKKQQEAPRPHVADVYESDIPF